MAAAARAQMPTAASIGGETITIPVPAGMERLDRVPPSWEARLRAGEATQWRRLAIFVPADALRAAERGQPPRLTSFLVISVRADRKDAWAEADWAQMLRWRAFDLQLNIASWRPPPQAARRSPADVLYRETTPAFIARLDDAALVLVAEGELDEIADGVSRADRAETSTGQVLVRGRGLLVRSYGMPAAERGGLAPAILTWIDEPRKANPSGG